MKKFLCLFMIIFVALFVIVSCAKPEAENGEGSDTTETQSEETEKAPELVTDSDEATESESSVETSTEEATTQTEEVTDPEIEIEESTEEETESETTKKPPNKYDKYDTQAPDTDEDETESETESETKKPTSGVGDVFDWSDGTKVTG